MDLLALATDVAREAGALLRTRFAAPGSGVGTKSSSTDMVSDADRASEDLIISAISRARPDDAILGEETGGRAGSSGLRWVIDPLDGTTNFLFGIPHWAVSIACEDSDGLMVGVVYDPMRAECFTAARGAGARLNDGPIAVTDAKDLQRALVSTGFSYRPEERAASASILPVVLPRVRDIRRAGAAALDLAWVACGRTDGYFETPVEWWDVAAGTVLVTEAGGIVGTLPSVGAGGIGYVAAGARLYPELRALVVGALAARAPA